MKEQITKLVLIGALAVALALLGSCDDDCPNCPEPKEEVEPDYHVLYCCESRPPQYVAYEYSLKYGTTVDSTFYGDGYGGFWDANFSADGLLTYYTRTAFTPKEPDSWTWVTDTRTGDTLAISSGKGARSLYVSRDGQYLLASPSRMITLFRLPYLEVVYHEDWSPEADGYNSAGFHPFENKFFFAKNRRGQDSIFVATFDTLGVNEVLAIPTHNRAGDAVHPMLGSLSPSGEYLIMHSSIFLGPKYFHVLDTDSFAIIHETQIPEARYHLDYAWHPEGRRVFMTYAGGFDSPEIGGIDVYDITTRTLEYFITSTDVHLENELLGAVYLCMSPNGKELVILNGSGTGSKGSIVVFDVATKLLTRRIDTFKPGYYSNALALIPIDWEREK